MWWIDLFLLTNIPTNISNILTFFNFFVLRTFIFHCYKNIGLLQLNQIISQILILFPLQLLTVKIYRWQITLIASWFDFSHSCHIFGWVHFGFKIGCDFFHTVHTAYLDATKHVGQCVLSTWKNIFSFVYEIYLCILNNFLHTCVFFFIQH